MEFDTLQLGPFTFEGFAPPDKMPLSTEQVLKIHKMPGGYRNVDVMGPDDENPRWNGFFYGDDAIDSVLTLYAMCKAGQELAFSWGLESRTVIIAKFSAHVEKPTYIHYDIELVYSDDSTSSAVSAGVSLGSAILSDLAAALSL